MTCGCKNEKCIGFRLLHEVEVSRIEEIKEEIISKHGDVEFDLKTSRSSGEIFTKFYELHVSK